MATKWKTYWWQTERRREFTLQETENNLKTRWVATEIKMDGKWNKMCNTLKQDDGLLKRDDTVKKDGKDTQKQEIVYLSMYWIKMEAQKTRWIQHRNYTDA